MGIGIWSKADNSKNTHLGYMSFGNIRMDLANAYSYEIGTIYESLYKTFNLAERIKLSERFNIIYEQSDNKTKTFMRFLCKEDTGASATKSMCKIILDLKEKVFEINKENGRYTEMYLKPFFKVIEDGCRKGIEWA